MNFYRMKDLIKLLTISRWTILRMIESGEFPKPVGLGPKSPRWPVNEVDDWIQERLAGRKAV